MKRATLLSLVIGSLLIAACSEQKKDNTANKESNKSWSKYRVPSFGILLQVPGKVQEQNGFFSINEKSLLQKAYIVDVENELYYYAFVDLKGNIPQKIEAKKQLLREKAIQRLNSMSAVIKDSSWNIEGDSINFVLKAISNDGDKVHSNTRMVLSNGYYHQFFVARQGSYPEQVDVNKFSYQFKPTTKPQEKKTSIVGYYSNDTLKFKTQTLSEPKIVSTKGDGEYGDMVMSFCTWFSKDSVTRMVTVVRYNEESVLADKNDLDRKTADKFFKELNTSLTPEDIVSNLDGIKVEKRTKKGFTVYKTVHTDNTIFQIVAQSADTALIKKGNEFVDSFETLE